jgi:DNA-binding GntR family transcriptional regulator
MVWQRGNWIINSEHRLLMEAIKRRDPVDAGQMLQLHIRRTRLGLAQHPELFEAPMPSKVQRKKS